MCRVHSIASPGCGECAGRTDQEFSLPECDGFPLLHQDCASIVGLVVEEVKTAQGQLGQHVEADCAAKATWRRRRQGKIKQQQQRPSEDAVRGQRTRQTRDRERSGQTETVEARLHARLNLTLTGKAVGKMRVGDGDSRGDN